MKERWRRKKKKWEDVVEEEEEEEREDEEKVGEGGGKTELPKAVGDMTAIVKFPRTRILSTGLL